MAVVRDGNAIPFVESVSLAERFFDRLRGLIGRPALSSREGLFLPRCKQVHMFFVFVPIDVVFLSASNTIVHICHRLRPWRISPSVSRAENVLELRSGAAAQLGLNVGDQLERVR